VPYKHGRISESLINGCAENVGAGILQTDGANKTFYELIENKPGIYVLYKGPGVYYVGQSITSANRIDQHFRDRLANKWDRFSFFQVGHKKYLDDLETLLIHATKSNQGKRNGASKGRFVRSRNLTKEFLTTFKKVMKIEEKTLRKERKELMKEIESFKRKYRPELKHLDVRYRIRINKWKRQKNSDTAKRRVAELRDERNMKKDKIILEWTKLETPLKLKKNKIEEELHDLRKKAKRVRRLTKR